MQQGKSRNSRDPQQLHTYIHTHIRMYIHILNGSQVQEHEHTHIYKSVYTFYYPYIHLCAFMYQFDGQPAVRPDLRLLGSVDRSQVAACLNRYDPATAVYYKSKLSQCGYQAAHVLYIYVHIYIYIYACVCVYLQPEFQNFAC